MDSTVMQGRSNPGHNSPVMSEEQLDAYHRSIQQQRGNISLPSFYWLLSVGALGAGTYHGYKRNRGSVGWTIGWAAFSAIAPVIAIPVAIAQGFGKPKKKR